MLALFLSLCAFPQTPSSSSAPSAPHQAPSAWDALAAEYEHVFEAWGTELSRSGGWEKPESERPPHPALSFWPRFEVLSEQGEGRAVLWQLDNAGSANQDGESLRRRLFERVRKAGDAEWVASALPRLGTQGLESEVGAYLAGLQAESMPKALRVTARLVEANLAQEKEPARAADLRLRAAFLQYRELELGPGEALAPEDLDELSEDLVTGLEKEQSRHFGLAYYEGSGGTYYPRTAAPLDPEQLWKPVVGTLAEKGCARARLWALANADWQLAEAEKERLRGYLDALCQGSPSAETLAALGAETDSLVYKLGLDFVEPRARVLIEKSAEAARPGMLSGLGSSLCEAGANDPAARERGLALLREVQTRWPNSSEAKNVAGLLFRFTNLVVGKTAPDFETVDVDGNAFKLSDYKGKVTVVDFWGFW